MKQKIIPIVSIVIGLLAFILTYQYLRGKLNEIQRERERLYAGAKTISVMVPVKDLPKGTTLVATDLTIRDVPAASASERCVAHEDGLSLLGKKTLYPLKAGSPILWPDIEGGASAVQGLSGTVQPGLRAISISVGGAAAVSGMVEPNDRVDVLGTFSFPSKTAAGEMEAMTLTVLQDVTVLATGQTTAKDQYLRSRAMARAASYSTVTLEVTPREAELLVFAQQLQGRLTLSLRNSADVTFEKDLPDVNFKYLESKLPELNLYRQQKIRHKERGL
ncbi:MAG: Flp pilus assembly protein CpaB [Planctomycetota bacterium]